VKIIIPMAGRGSRFAGNSDLPKPLIPVAGKPMIAWALESVRHIPHNQMIFIALAEHEQNYSVRKMLEQILGCSPELVLIDKVTDGQLCTVLTAGAALDTDEDILVASSDTFVVSDLADDIAHRSPDCRGMISVADLPGDRWSFARTDGTSRVVDVSEKVRISNHASTGLYYFSSGRELKSVGEEMIRNREKTRGEYYVIPVYQKFIQHGWRVDISQVRAVWDMGTPEAKIAFEEHIGS
jgi:UDP-N-acetylglucosamine diphosphorylase / glucose-1-phosphate thymidylyltransferase / UDP-N-acetylgalactosamine diphosphorylase / glucosamine-1-phosphate N-acetyltransferase / galactosamine-1-phosphate N-acetyltransferase